MSRRDVPSNSVDFAAFLLVDYRVTQSIEQSLSVFTTRRS